MNYVKYKARNKMKLKLLNAILAVKFCLIRLGKCSNYQLPPEEVKEIGTMAASQQNSSQPNTSATTQSFEEFDEDILQDIGLHQI